MEPGPAALLALLVMGFVPGALLHRAVRPTGSRLELAALAPTLSFALVFLFGQFTTLTGTPFAPAPFIVLVGLLAVVAAFRSRSRRARAGGEDTRPVGDRSAAGLLVAGIALSSLSWIVGLHGLASTPPYSDSVNHGVMAAHVSTLESLDPGRVLTSDILEAPAEKTETAFYPLALHGQVALAHRLFGVSVADGLLASTLLFSVLALPLGIFFAARSMFPGVPMLAGIAALLSGSLGFVPILPMSFGGLPLVIGLAMVPGAAVVVIRYLVGGGRPSSAAVGILGGIGILATHTSEIPLLIIVVGWAVAEACWRKEVSCAALVRRGLVFGASTLLLIGPTLPLLASGTTERAGIDEAKAVSLARAIRNLHDTVGSQRGIDFVGLLALVGLCVCLKRRRHLALTGTLGTILALYVVAACLDGPIGALTVPWYHHPGRIALNFVVVVPLLAAVAVMEIGPWLRRFAPATARSRSAAAPALAVAGLLAFSGFAVNVSGFRALFAERVRVGDDARAAFAYLKARVEPGERVLNDGNTDGAMWMYPIEGLVPLMGLQPARPGASWHERLWLVSHLPDLGKDPQVEKFLTKYRIRFVYFDEKNFDLNPHHVDGEDLLSTPGLCQRFNEGSVHVFEVAPGNVCA